MTRFVVCAVGGLSRGELAVTGPKTLGVAAHRLCSLCKFLSLERSYNSSPAVLRLGHIKLGKVGDWLGGSSFLACNSKVKVKVDRFV